jgi:hypothetical protein
VRDGNELVTIAVIPVISRLIVGFVAGVAGLLKLMRRAESAAGFARLLALPAVVARAGALAISVIEVVLAGALLSGKGLPIALPVATGLFAAFGASVLLLIRQGQGGKSCGCMGRGGRISGVLAAQDFGLSLLAGAAWVDVFHPAFLFLFLAGVALFLTPLAHHLTARLRGAHLRPTA